jgi:omega-6 fatty acid desaturase (delta-12 desaturase)
MNLIFGHIFGTIVSVSPLFWKSDHDFHHMHSNNIDKSQHGQTAPFTLEQFQKLTIFKRILYAILYNRFMVFTTTPILSLLNLRVHSSSIDVAMYSTFIYHLYQHNLLFTYICSAIIAMQVGVMIFHLQHTFDNTYRSNSNEWNFFKAGMNGSSYLNVPFIFKNITLGIEYHHIHHLNARVPCYNLQQCHDEAPPEMFDSVTRTYFSDLISTSNYFVYNMTTQNFESMYNVFWSELK